MNVIDKYFPVLDKGWIALKDVMGDDYSIEQAARVSYGKGTRKVNETRGLLRYLMRHKHTTPFEMVELKFHVKVPMDCWRQWIRHRTASVNEYSTRYSEAIDDCQTTPPGEWRLQAKSNKQGSSGYLEEFPKDFVWDCNNMGGPPSPHEIESPGKYLSEKEFGFHKEARELYEERLQFGIAKEQARKDLPLSTYTIAYWKVDLHNLFHFLRLRCDSHAQKEIRDYANVMAGIVKEVCPLAFEAWYDYSFGSVNFTRLDRELLDYLKPYFGLFNNEQIKTNKPFMEYVENLGVSKRELDEFWQKISVPDLQDFTLDFSSAKTPEELEESK